MTFWGVIVKPDQPYTFHGNQGGARRIRITQASLETPNPTFNGSRRLHVVRCQVGDQQPIVLCTVFAASAFTNPVDVEFEESQNIIFSTTGYYAIHLVGYYKEPAPQYLTCSHFEHLLNFPANADNDQKIDDDQGLEDLNRSNLDIFQTELQPIVANINKEAPKIVLMLEDETIDGFNNPIAAISNNEKTQPATVELETNMDINVTPTDVPLIPNTMELKKHNVSTEKPETEKHEVNGLELLLENRGRDEVVENDPDEIDALTGNEDKNGNNNFGAAITEIAKSESKNMETHSINGIIDVISTYEVTQPAIIEFENNSSRVAITKSDEIQLENIEIGEVIMAVNDLEECVPDSEDSWDNDVSENQYLTNMMKKQKMKKSIAAQFHNENLGIVEHDSKVQSIETNVKDLHIQGDSSEDNHHKSKKKKKNKSMKIHQYMNEESDNIEVVNATTIASSSSSNYEGKPAWRSNTKDGHQLESVEVTNAKSGVIIENNSYAPTKLSVKGHEDGTKKLEFCNIQSQSRKMVLANDNNSLNPKPKKKNKTGKQMKFEIGNNTQRKIVSCSNDDDCKSNRTLSTRMMQDQQHDSDVPSTLLDANVSVNLKRKKRKGDSKHFQ